jgi:hypothetical protein
MHHKYPSSVVAGLIDDLPLAIVAAVPGAQQPDRTVIANHNRTGITACIATVIPDYLLRAPGLAIVNGPLHQQVNIAAVTSGMLAPFAKRQNSALGRDN